MLKSMRGLSVGLESETFLEQYYFERYILEVCIATLERGGTTSRPDTYQFLSSVEAWGLPKYPDRTVILPPDANLLNEVTVFIHTNIDFFQEKNCWLGTWIDPQTHNCYLDITAIYTCLDEARREAITLCGRAQRKIVALYDFKQGRTVYL
ncbi:MAG TPA: hypothetical protein VJ761_04675 [Ktedonobacteraceae bacterium]|nr:hypothetical protein [Ktedonobacteraceae bacterium]